MKRSIHWLILLMVLQSACHLPSGAPPASGPTFSPPATAFPTPTLSLPGFTFAPPPAATQVVPTSPPLPTALPINQSNPAPTFLGQHQVRAGETLSCIARAYGVLPSAIMQANSIANVDAAVVGQVLNIPPVQWTNIPEGQVCQKQFNSPFPAGQAALVSSSPTPLPANFEDLKRELFLGLGGGGPTGPDCVAMYEASPPASLPAISGLWLGGSFGAPSGNICLYGFPMDQVLTMSLLDRQGGNVLYMSSFVVQGQNLMKINSSGQILQSVGSVVQASPTSVIKLFLWPDPQVKFMRITATNLAIESSLSPVQGVFVDFTDKARAALDPFAKVDTCPDFPAGSEIHIYGYGFQGINSATVKIFSTKASMTGEFGAAHHTNDSSVAGIETILRIDQLFTSSAVTPAPDGSFQLTLRTDPLARSRLYVVRYEPALSTQTGFVERSCFTVTNRQLIYADRLPAPPAIDGETRDWATLMNFLDRPTYGFENWTGFSDMSGWYSFGWDQTFLYIAASVVDDRYVQSQHDDLLYLGDSLELLLGDPLSAPTTFRVTDYQLGFSLGNLQTGQPPAQAYLWFPSSKRGLPPGTVVKGKQKQFGYDMEIAIPWAALGRTPAPGQQFRFVLSMSDNDVDGTAAQQSLVSSSAGRVLADPITWGLLQLGE